MTKNDKIPGRGWTLVLIGWGALFLAAFGTFALGLILPDLREEFGFGLEVSGALSSITFVVKTFIYIPLALLATRMKPKLLLGFIFGTLGVPLLLHGLASGVTMLYLGRAIMAVASAGIVAPLVLVKTNWIPSSRMAQINGYEYFVTSFGQLVGTSGVVVLIAVLGGWRNMLITLGAVGIALAVAWFLLYKENDKVGAIKMPGKQPFIAPLKKALKQKAIWLLAIGWPGTTLVWIAFTTFWPTYATESLGLSMAQAGMLLGIIPIASAIACLTSPKLTNWIGVDKLMIWPWGFILPVAYYVALKTSSIPVLAVMFFIAGYGAFAFVPVGTTVVYKLPGMDSGSISAGVSVVQTMTSIGGALAGVIIGSLGNSMGLADALGICCLSPVIFGVLTLFLPEYGRKATEKAKKLAQEQENAAANG